MSKITSLLTPRIFDFFDNLEFSQNSLTRSLLVCSKKKKLIDQIHIPNFRSIPRVFHFNSSFWENNILGWESRNRIRNCVPFRFSRSFGSARLISYVPATNIPHPFEYSFPSILFTRPTFAFLSFFPSFFLLFFFPPETFVVASRRWKNTASNKDKIFPLFHSSTGVAIKKVQFANTHRYYRERAR